MRVSLIGFGNIGKELYKTSMENGWDIESIVRSSGVYNNLGQQVDHKDNYFKHTKKSDIVFLSISTEDNGETALNYMRSHLENRIPVVTCEKGALANYFAELSGFRSLIGYNATVGGGIRMLEFLEKLLDPSIVEIGGIVNGTVNYIINETEKGKSLEDAVQETIRLGYAEPGARNVEDIIRNEIERDIPMKTSIIWNISGLGDTLSARELIQLSISKNKLENFLSGKKHVISISREDSFQVLGGFRVKSGKWYIKAGFSEVRENSPYSFPSTGAGNFLFVRRTNKIYLITGQGAGVKKTTSSMIKDAEILMKKHHH